MQKKQFISDLIFIQILNILVKAFWILWIDREIQNWLPPEAYGQYYSLLGFSILFIILLDAGINNFNSREVARNPQFFQENFAGIIITKLLLSVVYILAAFSVASALDFSTDDLYIVALLLIFQIIASLNLYLRSNIAAHQQFKLDGFLGVLDRLLVVIICSFLLYNSMLQPYLTIRTFILAQIIGVSGTFMVAFYLNVRKLDKFRINFKPALFRDIVFEAFPYALLIILMGLFTRMDVVMLKTLLPDHLQADQYAKAYRLLDAANMLAMLLSGMLLPLFSRMIERNESLSEIVRISAKVLILPAIPVVALLAMHSREVMELLYPGRFEAGLDQAFIFITLSFFGYALIYIYGTLLTAKADLRYLNYSAAVTALLNILLNWWWIPKQGALGAAQATLISQSLFAALCYFRARKVFELKTALPLLLRYGLVTVLILAVIFGTGQFIEKPLVHSLLSVAISLIIFAAAKIFRPIELLQLLKR